MSEQQPEALRIADDLKREWSSDALNYDTALDASVELPRLHELNQELLDALKSCVKVLAHGATTPERQAADPLSAMNVGRALIAKAGGVPSRCPLCSYQHGHAIGCENNPVDIALKARASKRGGS